MSTEAVYSGPNKWRGMAAVGTKLYAVPDRANLLVLDLDSEDTDHVYGIDTDSVGTGIGERSCLQLLLKLGATDTAVCSILAGQSFF